MYASLSKNIFHFLGCLCLYGKIKKCCAVVIYEARKVSNIFFFWGRVFNVKVGRKTETPNYRIFHYFFFSTK